MVLVGLGLAGAHVVADFRLGFLVGFVPGFFTTFFLAIAYRSLNVFNAWAYSFEKSMPTSVPGEV